MKLPTRILSIFRRIKLSTQILLTFLIAVKLILGSVLLYQVGVGSIFMETDAIAAAIQTDTAEAAEEDAQVGKKDELDLKLLNTKKAALAAEEKRIAVKKAELVVIQKELNNKLEKLTQLRNEIRSEIAGKEAVETKKLKHLIKVYSSMKPQSAAVLIEKLDKNLAIELLANMKGDVVGKILSYVDTGKAAAISEGLVSRE
jgi:flagellar motility protein MotE (MotC chaperone)